MTPQLAARLTIHEPDLAGMPTGGEAVLSAAAVHARSP